MSQYIEKIYSKIDSNLLLHQVIRSEVFDDAKFRIDVVDKNESLQLALLNLSKDQTFRPHRHVYKDYCTSIHIAGESWIVVRGSILFYAYDIDNTIIETKTLKAGDITVTVSNAGHNYKALEENTHVVEVKVGPYKGIEWDKELI